MKFPNYRTAHAMIKIIHTQSIPSTNHNQTPFCDIRLDKWQRTNLNRTDTTDPYFRSLKYPTAASHQLCDSVRKAESAIPWN